MIEIIDSYFFAEVNPLPYATMRIMLGILLICTWVEFMYSLDICKPVQEGGLISNCRLSIWNVPTIFKQFNCPFWIFLILYGISAVCILIGLFSVFFIALSFYLTVSFRSYALSLCGGSDQVIQVLCFWMIFSNPDAMFSVFPVETTSVSFAGRGLIVNMSLFYCLSVVLKYKGKDWRNGMAIWNVMNFPDKHKWRYPAKFLENKKIIVQSMTYFVIIVETLAPLGFLVKPLIPVWVFFLMCMHIGIELTMFVGLFGYCSVSFLIFLFLTYLYW